MFPFNISSRSHDSSVALATRYHKGGRVLFPPGQDFSLISGVETDLADGKNIKLPLCLINKNVRGSGGKALLSLISALDCSEVLGTISRG
jgi:hypothetical protein